MSNKRSSITKRAIFRHLLITRRAIFRRLLQKYLLCLLLSIVFSPVLLACFQYSQSKSFHAECAIVAACQVTDSNIGRFRIAFASWIEVVDVDEIIVVDWSSSVDLAKEVGQLSTGSEKSVILHKLHTRTGLDWRLTSAYNHAFDLVKSKYVFKVDCDTFLHPDVYSVNRLKNLTLRVASWKSATDENGLHLNGVFLTKTASLRAVAGFDERFELYGWDDSDLYERISKKSNLFGGDPRTADFVREHHGSQLLSHLKHARRRPASLEEFGICWNRYLIEQGSRHPWHAHMKSSCASLFRIDHGVLQLSECTLYNLPTPFNVEASANSQKCLESMQKCVEQTSPDFIPVHLCFSDRKIDARDTFRSVDFTSAYSIEDQSTLSSRVEVITASGLRILALEVTHDIGNRIRALASVAAIAKRFHLVLVLVWKLDINNVHAKISDLFSYWPASITTSADLLEILERDGHDVLVYNFLLKTADVKLPLTHHTYVKPSFIVGSVPAVKETEMDSMLNSMQVNHAVQDIVNEHVGHLGSTPILGAHIQTADISKELSTSDEGAAAMDEYVVYRKHCRASHFVARIRNELKDMDSNSVIYVASDSRDAIGILIKEFGYEKVIHTNPSLSSACMGDTTTKVWCLQVALAESEILSRSERLVLSTWSSATDIVARRSSAKHIISGCATTSGSHHWYDWFLGSE